MLTEAARQLDRYFARKLERFDLPLAQRGTDFQKRVWAAMRDIPYGETATYGGMAMALGSGPRPVGMACARNPIPIIVPCHRVLGSGGKEGGFSGGKGLPTKRQLLATRGRRASLSCRTARDSSRALHPLATKDRATGVRALRRAPDCVHLRRPPATESACAC